MSGLASRARSLGRRSTGLPQRAWTSAAAHLGAASLRTRLVGVVIGLLVLALAVTSAVTLAVLYRVQVGQVDADLRTATSSQAATARVYNSAQNFGPGYPSDYGVEAFYSNGDVAGVTQEPSNAHHGVLELTGITAAWTRAHPDPTTVHGVDGRRWRVRAVLDPAQTAQGVKTVSVVIARPLDDVDDSVAHVAAWLLAVGLAVVLAGALLGTWAISRAFRPLREVEQVAGAFRDGDTSRRVRSLPTSTEVGRVGAAINAMLARIETTLAAREASEARMRRFAADASHELRTPLAAIRGFAELHRMGAVRGEADVARAFDRIETESTRMGGLVDDLLTLARLDEQRPMRSDPVDLLLIAADAAHDARALAPERTVAVVGVDGAAPVPTTVTGDDARLRQVLTNLVANALRHTPAGTPVEIGVGVRAGWALWQVVDHGPGIPPEDAERVFERFWRADSSRQRGAGGGAGLGMAIVAAIVAAHRGAVRVVTTPGGGATIEVALPLAAARVDGAHAGTDDSADLEDPADPDDVADEGDDVTDDGDDDTAEGDDRTGERLDPRPTGSPGGAVRTGASMRTVVRQRAGRSSTSG